ncbi:DUF805 domain-containing protein [Kineococcus aurantiacus]|nr:DUF805 domain-containing protein [Kineococcus aurantiacus]
MVEAVTSVFRNYATFSGRARRAEYWWFTLAVVLLSVVYSVLAAVAQSVSSSLATLLTLLFSLVSLALLVPSIAVTVRRLHDTGKSGFFYFLSFIPLVGGIVLLVFCVQDSVPGPNHYGPNPKGVGGGHQTFPGQPPQFGGPTGYGQGPDRF